MPPQPALHARRLLGGLALLGLAVLAAHLLLGGGERWRVAVLTAAGTAVLVGAIAVCAARAVLVARDRVAWAALALGLASWTVGWVVAAVTKAVTGERAPVELADAFYLAFYPAAYVGLGLLVRARVRRFPASAWLDGVMSACALGALLVWALGGGVGDDLADPLALAVHLAYPVADLTLLSAAGGALVLAGPRPERLWGWLGAGFALFAAADVAYLVAASRGDGASVVHGALWLGSALLVARGAWSAPRAAARPVETGTGPLLLAPVAFAAIGIGLLALGQSHPLPRGTTALATLALVLVVARTALTFVENARLLEAAQQAMTDELTGLANRRRLQALLRALLDEAPAPAPVGLLLIDLDRFKEVNDTLGHHAGDLLLEQVAARLRATLGDAALVARLGGDEFAVVLTDGPDPERLEAAARALGRDLAAPFALEGLAVTVAASVGGALAPAHATRGAALLQRADVAMYDAKRTGGGYAAYRPERDRHSRARLEAGEHLRRAVAAGDLVLAARPRTELASGAVDCVEVLPRWERPGHGAVDHRALLALAEEHGLAGALTLRVLEDALRHAAAWGAAGRPLAVAVDLAPASLRDGRLPDEVARLLACAGLPAERLVLEVPQDAVVEDAERTAGVAGRLRALGVRLALDGFGAGRSTFADLRRLPLDEVKLDPGLVRSMARDPRDAAVVRASAQLARTLGVRVVAEGVEDAAAWPALAALGVDALQGPVLGPALAPAEVPAWLGAREGPQARAA